MIIDVVKYLIVGSKNHLDAFFEKAQEKGFIEFIGPTRRKKEFPQEIQNLLSAIKILKKRPVKNKPKESIPIKAETIAERVVHANSSLDHLHEQHRVLKSEIARVQIFGDFSLDDVSYLESVGKRFLQFFTLKSSKAKDMKLPEEMIYIGTEYDLDYFVAVNKEKKAYPSMIELHIEKPIGLLQAHLQRVQEEIASFEKDLKEFTAYLPLLKKAFADLWNAYSLKSTKNQAMPLLNDALFASEAWIPVNKVNQIEKLIGELAVHLDPIKIEEKDRVPTYIENKGFAKVGEDLVHVYDTPAAKDKDPSIWIFWSFALFFAVIVADAGYGLLYLALALFLKWKFPDLKNGGKRFVKLLFILSSTCIVWGVLTASFFGLEIGPNNPYRRISLIHYLATEKAEYHVEHQDDVYDSWVNQYPDVAKAKDGHEFLVAAVKYHEDKPVYEALKEFYDDILMELSLLMGVIHICISFLRYLFRNWAGIGWVGFIIGGYLFFPSILGATSLIHILHIIPKDIAFAYGEMILYAGLILAIVLSLIQNRLHGLHEIFNSIQIFGDILSYLRLYALALASMIMAATFNEMAVSMGWIAGFFVILVGHSVNIILGAMAGVIHGLRLNFLEWYHYCYEGGGKLFNPLRLIKNGSSTDEF